MIQSIQTVLKYDNAISCTNMMAAMEDFVVSKEINYTYMALSQTNLFYLTYLLLWIFLNMRRHCVFYVRVKKHLIAAFMKMNSSWILVSLPTLLYVSLTLSELKYLKYYLKR